MYSKKKRSNDETSKCWWNCERRHIQNIWWMCNCFLLLFCFLVFFWYYFREKQPMVSIWNGLLSKHRLLWRGSFDWCMQCDMNLTMHSAALSAPDIHGKNKISAMELQVIGYSSSSRKIQAAQRIQWIPQVTIDRWIEAKWKWQDVKGKNIYI